MCGSEMQPSNDYQRGWRDGWATGWQRAHGWNTDGPLPPSVRVDTIDDLPHGLDPRSDGFTVFVSREAREYRWCGAGLHWHSDGRSCAPPDRDTIERLLQTKMEDWQWELLKRWSAPGAPNPHPEPTAPGTGDPSCAGNAGTGR